MMKNLRQQKTAMQANCIIAIIFAVVLGFAFPKVANAYSEAIGERNDSPVKYGLMVAGVYVTNENCNDLSVIDGVSGTVKYVPETNTLYLENATITADYGIYNQAMSGLTINITGENYITATNNGAISLGFNPTTIKGDGTLNAVSNSFCALSFEESLEIDNCTVNAKGKWGIAGEEGTSETLTIRNATVSAEGNSGSICDIASLTLDGSYIERPSGAAFDETLHAIALDGQTVTDKVVISPTVPITYLLKVADVYVTSKNCNDLSVIHGVSGTVKYDPETNTLYLENATITAFCGIYSQEVSGLTINVTGENYITATNNSAISLGFNPTTINGDGTLTAESNDYCALYFKESLEIDNCTVNAKGKWGIAGEEGTSETLTIRNATVSAEGNIGSVCDILSLTLDGATITQPIGAAFDGTLHAVALDGQTVTDKVVITTEHTVGINDVKAETSEQKQCVYSLDGVFLGHDFEALPKGIYIKNGSKVIKK